MRDTERRPDHARAGPLDLDAPKLLRSRMLESLHQPSRHAQLDAIGEPNGDQIVTGVVGRRDRLVWRLECRPRNRRVDVGVRRDDLVRRLSHRASPPRLRPAGPYPDDRHRDCTEAGWVLQGSCMSQRWASQARMWHGILAEWITFPCIP